MYDYTSYGVYYPGKLFFDQVTVTTNPPEKEVTEVKMVPYEVDLTQDDIDGGCRSKSSNCPGALAINRAVAHLGLYSSVGAYATNFYDEPIPLDDFEDGREPLYSIDNPGALRIFVPNFDGGNYVCPIKFTIELPEDLRTYTVKLSGKEANTLSAILAKVGGNPSKSPREHAASVSAKLKAAGVPSYSKVEEYDLSSGSVMFREYGTPRDKGVNFW